ncbi:hypothetical protein J3U01_00335 [Bifidobacterium sp. B4107]|uniref:hypothetical protein n=1 Tax=unclassified Bifidobacterium TaxID=2608897 RepID=UPI00226B2F05|nr:MULTISPECIES: hypothetical protein [unclassified Bifidobacterium]MCX8646879.1 hypothetical protein [Bifidobacterium sp. B4107]MCX8651064.1 hypothetical protein [Bifidobacterium sp. B4111]MCX8657494.1 hypothetical protein [Bifidobacterium sp. B4114]
MAKDDQPERGKQNGEPSEPATSRPRRHHRVVRPGRERFDVDGTEEDPQDRVCAQDRLDGDDRRILGELPPHWGLFPNERGD